jgi:hypothetical protein
MRTTCQIICAVKDNKPVEHEELRLALLALNSIEHFSQHHLQDIIEAADDSPKSVAYRIAFAKSWMKRRFAYLKTDPIKYLGPAGIPGNPEHDESLTMAKSVFKKATGVDLDSED